jgi:ferredoxin-type protein NapF
MKKLFRISNIRAFSSLLALLLTIPFAWKGLTGFYVWLSPFVMLNSVFTLKSFVLLNSAAFIVLLFVIIKKRWFCRFLCPVGYSCDLISGLSRQKISDFESLPDIGKWVSIISLSAAIVGLPIFILLDPMAIFNGFFSAISEKPSILTLVSLSGLPVLLAVHIFFPGIWCRKLCPLGGMQEVLAEIKTGTTGFLANTKKEISLNGVNRRLFIASGIGLTAGLMIPRILQPRTGNYLKPPASVESDLFNTLCIRCGNCIKVCPTGIITHHTSPGSIMALMTPEVRFKDGYCLESCNMCSKVCPSGAIILFNTDAKSQLFMGTAEVHLDNCLLTKYKECDRCKISCKYSALNIVHDNLTLKSKPDINTIKCVGCGACEVICPESAIEIKPILSL